ncbi:inactive rhomboid protein 1-like isoform X1 [Biomphalaria glabrata]|uniref:Inactive rhomboid protein 1-like isoform X1 n=1 Tax=Biomphalaria glabrata TaxID=6526 RepID=A0A2C9JG69_BIOGL|nr:inactive rhomboid protein 1-like isoform X1 [Biomphalaria glabrata]XP_055876715.1 inactive rhomboid protein 1-like isoform X1 [Biomphalaria glabrata]XP_055876716.1 inactive rhomboid protein 1-like isoform X1 [Biomphalaria glabrata]XP_055876717.1 inactive rhomboid protein 1-like isoform X1 [Biomphalaria glabrata]XP_055876718.1 inactive rhomboid protein 1-like isoform X1 [Biomphalaria glabrata]XP_055876719.1 inactive rhomboid protein 1-like isoform X1 [Biomphalaria glabrata]
MSSDDDISVEPSAARLAKYRKNTRKSVAVFFGVDEENKNAQKWEKRRMRMASSMGKGIKEEFIDEEEMEGPMMGYVPPVDVRKKSVVAMTYHGLKPKSALVKQEIERRKSMKIPGQNFRRVSISAKIPTDKMEEKPGIQFQPHKDAFFDESIPRQRLKPTKQIEDSEDKVAIESSSSKMEAVEAERVPSPSIKESYLIEHKQVGFQKINETVISKKDKRQLGMGTMGSFTRRRLKSTVMASKEIKKQLDDFEDYRPYFSYWVTTVQVLIFIIAISVYGIAPIGVGKATVVGNVPMPSLAIQTESELEKRNMWIGPRQADLIHLGAKYSPCMRPDENLITAIELDITEERSSACCIRNDGSGCVQTVKSGCSYTLSSWYKWNLMDGTEFAAMKTGSVCGQDPKFCNVPSSTPPFEWGDDITKWPICRETVKPNRSLASPIDRHMNCEILGRPCCFGIQGQCIITTRDHCDLKRGFFHSEATLCAQVRCFEEICGMIPFARPHFPDQFYRLFTALFLHGGVLHVVITVIFQMWVLRDLEKLMGCVRISIIYIGSGVAGYLASCIFIPYSVEVGPSGSQFGVAACLIVEVLQSYQMYKHPFYALLKVSTPLIFLFLLGLLPWFDNWAHIFGFFFGFLLAFSLMPYITFGTFDKHRKLVGIALCLGSAIGLFAILVLVFYVAPLTECSWCIYLNCIPFTPDFCENMMVKIKKNATYSMYQ